MKQFLALAFLLFIGLFVTAQNNSNLTISTTGNGNLRIILAGKRYSLQDRSVTFQSLAPGSYTLTIYQWKLRGNGQGSDYSIVYDRSITLSANRHLEVCVLRFGNVATDEQAIDRDNWNENFRNPEPDREWRQGNEGYDRRGYGRPVNETDFARIKKAISGEFYDEDKLTMAKVVLKDNWFTAEQIKQLGNLFFYDDNKLAFAKFAYDYCTDRGNYFLVADILFYESNKKELLKYIGNR